MSNASMACRRRPLYTCGTSTLTIARGLYRRAVELKGPIGSVTRRLAKLGSGASPLVYAIQYQWLTVLAFVDGYFLLLEKIVEKCMPVSRHVFDRIDNMVDKVEDLPKKFDHAVKSLPDVLHKIPLLEWAVMYAIKWLEFLTSVLVIWGLGSTEEKEIRVDTSCKNEKSKEKEPSPSSRATNVERPPDLNAKIVVPTTKCSYKEALEKGVKKNTIVKDKEQAGKYVKRNVVEDDAKKQGAKNDVIVTKKDSLLELFYFGWQTPMPSQAMLRSASYT